MSLLQLPKVISLLNDLSIQVKQLEVDVRQLQKDITNLPQVVVKPKKND